MLLLCYRIKFPHLIHLLRGNHECSKMNRLYGFYEELRRKRCIYLWKKFQEVFNEMPLCAVVSSRLLCMHGGISPEIQNWDSLVTLQKPKTPRACDDGIAVDLMWSDPSTDSCTGFQFNATRATSYIFGGDTIANICDMLDISMVVRAHEVVRAGHQFMYDKKLVTLFSAPNYCGTDGNAASVMKVSRRLELSFVTLKPRLDTNRLTEEKRLLLEKLAADAMAKSPDPCSRLPKEKEKVSNNDDCLIGPITPGDPKGIMWSQGVGPILKLSHHNLTDLPLTGAEMQQRKSELLSLMDAIEVPQPKPKGATTTKPAPTIVPIDTSKSGTMGASTVTARKRDTTPAPPVSGGAPVTSTKPSVNGTSQQQASPSPQTPNTARIYTPKQMITSPLTQNSGPTVSPTPPVTDRTAPSATSKPTSGTSPLKRPSISLLYRGTNGQASIPGSAPATVSAAPAPSKPGQVSPRGQITTAKGPPSLAEQPTQEPKLKEIVSGTSDSTSNSAKNSESLQGVVRPPPSRAKSVEEAAKTAIAATKTPPKPDPKSQNEIINATEKALKDIKPAEPKK
ncbi:hypothetical protein COOONC_26866 [Cooperia oncophora]